MALIEGRKTVRQRNEIAAFLSILILSTLSCKDKNASSGNQINYDTDLKQGTLISCSPPEKQFGSVDFPTSCQEKTRKDFNLAISLLHSFEYDEAEKVFASILNKDPDCAMAYWGVAMCN